MREIKFRAWNTKTKTMVDLRKITPLALSIDPSIAGAGIGLYIPDHPDMIIEQFTGLRDKNMQEIYEGDVVRFEMSYNTETWTGEVKYEDCVAGFMICAMKGEPWCSREFGIGTLKVEIIGNIHENPDLL